MLAIGGPIFSTPTLSKRSGVDTASKPCIQVTRSCAVVGAARIPNVSPIAARTTPPILFLVPSLTPDHSSRQRRRLRVGQVERVRRSVLTAWTSRGMIARAEIPAPSR